MDPAPAAPRPDGEGADGGAARPHAGLTAAPSGHRAATARGRRPGRSALLVVGFGLLGLALAAVLVVVQPRGTTLTWQASFSAVTGASSAPIANADLLSTRGRTIAYLASSDALQDPLARAHPGVRSWDATYVNGTNVVELGVSAASLDDARSAMTDYMTAVRTVASEAAGVDGDVVSPIGTGPSQAEGGLPPAAVLLLGFAVPALVVAAVLVALPRLRAAADR